jgi:hypothetical protein
MDHCTSHKNICSRETDPASCNVNPPHDSGCLAFASLIDCLICLRPVGNLSLIIDQGLRILKLTAVHKVRVSLRVNADCDTWLPVLRTCFKDQGFSLLSAKHLANGQSQPSLTQPRFELATFRMSLRQALLPTRSTPRFITLYPLFDSMNKKGFIPGGQTENGSALYNKRSREPTRSTCNWCMQFIPLCYD